MASCLRICTVCDKQFQDTIEYKRHKATCGVNNHDISEPVTIDPTENTVGKFKDGDDKLVRNDSFSDFDKVASVDAQAPVKEVVKEIEVEVEVKETDDKLVTEFEKTVNPVDEVIEEVKPIVEKKEKAPKSKGTTQKVSPRSKMKQK